MKTKTIIGALAAWTVIVTAILLPLVSGCSSFRESKIVEEISDEETADFQDVEADEGD